MEKLFFTAAKTALRFSTTRGQVSAEDLFKMPLTSKSGFSLNDVAIALDDQITAAGRKDFVGTVSKGKAELEMKLEIVKAVIADKQAENEAARTAKNKAEEKQRLMELLDRKKNEADEGLTAEQIQAKLDALG